MKPLWFKNMVLLLPILSLGLSSMAYADIQPCGINANKTGKSFKVNGTDITVRTGPGKTFDKVINEKASRILNTTVYITIDKSVTVHEECSQNGWSKIYVTEPDYLTDSHQGWVLSKFLRETKRDQSGVEVFTESDFSFDKKTLPYKKIIIAGVNKVHREDARCKKIEPSSAYISSTKGSSSNPVFYVTCGSDIEVFNVFFSKSDIEKDLKLSEIKHIVKSEAIKQCENYAKSNAVNPSTVDFSNFIDLSVKEHPNGNTTVISSFSAKNRLNLKLKYNIRCLSNARGLFEASITETK